MAAGDPIRELPAQLQSYFLDVLPFAAPLVGVVAITVTLYLLAAAYIRRAGAWS